MKPLLQLNLNSDREKTDVASLPKPEGEASEPLVIGPKLNRMAKKIAHRAATEYGRSGSRIFSK